MALLVTNTCAHELTSPRKLIPHVQPRTQERIGKNVTKLADNVLAHECGTLQTVKQQNYS
jgi:hypothetical protein